MLCRILWLYGAEVVLYISGVGFCVARFGRQGNAKASDREASNSAGLHAFFYVLLHRFNRGVALSADLLGCLWR